MNAILEQIQKSIEQGHSQETIELVRTAIRDGITAKEVVEEGMFPAMKVMTEEYKNGDGDIPRILTTARCIRKGFDIIEQESEGYRQKKIGKVILGTVEGDLHDVTYTDDEEE